MWKSKHKKHRSLGHEAVASHSIQKYDIYAISISWQFATWLPVLVLSYLWECKEDSFFFHATLVNIRQTSNATMVFSTGTPLVSNHTLFKILSLLLPSCLPISLLHTSGHCNLSLQHCFTTIFRCAFQYIQSPLGKIPEPCQFMYLMSC